jgi:cation diffusion facilitator CzcD-associated flavoprotein CzcO
MSVEAQTLDELAARARFELGCLDYPARDWVRPRFVGDAPVHDAVIVGGGQNGMAIAFRLMRERVSNIRVLDAKPFGQEGPWRNFARMHTLRTPKTVSGPDLGIPSLSIQAWYLARYGRTKWGALGKILREDWHDYLAWLRQTAGIGVTNDAVVTDIEPLADDLLAVHVQIGDVTERILARNVVLATGIEGAGRWMVPEVIAKALPRARYAHTADAIDFAAMAGKAVAVIGGGASAFDNAAMALEAGAAGVDMLIRRPALPHVNPNRWIEFAGFMRHFGDLDDARKWAFMQTIFAMNQPPPQDTFERCAHFPNFTLHFDSPVLEAGLADTKIRLVTPRKVITADALIVATGFAVNLADRPELARFYPKIVLWSDRYQPSLGAANAMMGRYPYLSSAFQFTEKHPGEAPFLKRIYNHTYGAQMSLGGAAGISQLKFSAERIALGITRQLFLDDGDHFLASLRSYDASELDMTPYDAVLDRRG